MSIGLVIVLVLAGTAAAQDSNGGPVELSVRAGFDGYYKEDYWVPVRVSAANEGPAVEGYLQVVTGGGFGSDQIIYRSPISLPTSSNKGQTLFVHLPDLTSGLVVELIDDAGQVVATTESNRLSALAADALLYGVVTREPGRLEYLKNVNGGRSQAAVAYLGRDELPEVAAGLNGLDIIVFHREDSGRLTTGQSRALASWLDTGGQIVVTGGPEWQETTAGLAEMLPVNITGVKPVDDIPTLRDLSGLPFRDPGPYLVVESELKNGEALIVQEGSPLLARRDHGRGSVFFLALDPSLAPLLDWDGSEVLWSEIASHAVPLPDWARGARHSYAATDAVSSLPASDLPAAWALFFFLMLYVVVVGPLNYWLLRRLGRRELAWLTIPGLVVLFSVTAYLLGFRLKGEETIVNQMSVIYGHVDGEQARVQTLIGLYSPKRAAYDMILPSQAIPRPFERTYGELSGPGNIEAIERAETVTVSGIRVDVAGVETLVADSYRPMPDVAGSVRLRPVAGDLMMDIAVQNNGPVALDNATFLVGALAISLGDLGPGEGLTHSEQIAAPPASSTITGPLAGYVPPAPGMSPLLANMDTILGSTDYYNNREIYPRWQLLQSMAPDYGVSAGGYAADAFTLIAWSDQPQLDIGLHGQEPGALATSLYFLELPAHQELSGGQETVVPKPLLSWSVLREDGVYDARIDDLFLTQGSVDFEFVPWSNLQSMTVNDLTMVLLTPDGLPSQQPPLVQLWDWAEASWRTPGDPAWGRFAIEDPLSYVGPGNAVRVRLTNPGSGAINIQQIYPELTGRFE